MEKHRLFVCRYYEHEYRKALDSGHYDNILLVVYPALCDEKNQKVNAAQIMAKLWVDGNSTVVCSNTCDVISCVPDHGKESIRMRDFCFSRLLCDEFIQYLIARGAYLVTTGWLKEWKKHLDDTGFDRETARRFYKENIKELLYLDAGNKAEDMPLMTALAEYLDLPFGTLPLDLYGIRHLLDDIKHEQKRNLEQEAYKKHINELRNQCAEYSALFDIHAKILTYTGKADVVEKIRELFLFVFGAREFHFHDAEEDALPEEIETLRQENKTFSLFREQNRFLLKVAWGDLFLGVIEAGRFLFPEYIEKYLNLALEVSKVCALVLYNNRQYGELQRSREKYEYLSFHDGLTGLYNRAFVKKVMAEEPAAGRVLVFVFDIDGLKKVNDQYGHLEGDKLIKAFAGILKRNFREKDIVARIGGDEFAVILTDHRVGAAEHITKRIESSIESHNTSFGDATRSLYVSIGYAMWEQGTGRRQSIETLMRKADERMYLHKKSKRQEIMNV